MKIILYLLLATSFLDLANGQNIQNTGKVIVVLGSSTSYGYLASPIDSSYVDLLRLNLHLYHRCDTIINLAYPGYTTYNIQPTGSIPSPDTGSIQFDLGNLADGVYELYLNSKTCNKKYKIVKN